MSYVVHIWEEAAPASLQEADRLHERLAGTAAAPNPKFRQMALRLIQRFPAEVGGRGEVDESWVESSPDGATNTRVYSLGLFGGGVTQLLPALVDEANALGLTVYDDQAARAWLPGAWVLDADGRHARQPEPPPAAVVLNMALVKARVKAVVSPVLAPRGFVFRAEPGQFRWTRSCGIGDQELALITRNDTFGIELKPHGTVIPRLPTALAKVIPPNVAYETRQFDPGFLRYQVKPDSELEPYASRQFVIPDATALDGFLHAYCSVALTAVLPFLDATIDVPGFVQVYRHPQAWQAVFRPSHGVLALAHWVGAADFDALLAVNRAGWRHKPAVAQALEQMVARLKDLPEVFGSYPKMD